MKEQNRDEEIINLKAKAFDVMDQIQALNLERKRLESEYNRVVQMIINLKAVHKGAGE